MLFSFKNYLPILGFVLQSNDNRGKISLKTEWR